MKKLILIIALVLISSISSAQFGVWTEQNSGVTVTLTSLDALSGSGPVGYVWACGYSGTVLFSSNLGVTWQNVSGNGIPSNVQLINIEVFSDNVVLTAGYIGSNTFVYRTTNRGAKWTQVFTETGGFINAIALTSYPNGFMTGDPVGGRWSLWRTTDLGATWDSAGCYLPRDGTSEAGWNNSLDNDGMMIYFGTNNNKIYRSSNGGTAWTSITTGGEMSSYAVGAFMPDIFSGGANLMRSSNNGLNWTNLSVPGASNIGAIKAGSGILINFTPAFVFYVRSNSTIYRSTNSGLTFAAQYTAPAGNYRYIGTNQVETQFWAVRDNGGISFMDLGVGVQMTGTEIPQRFSLYTELS